MYFMLKITQMDKKCLTTIFLNIDINLTCHLKITLKNE